MLNCKDMTKLISDSLERKITVRQRMELWLHIMMCGMCRRFRSNIIALRVRARGALNRKEISKVKTEVEPSFQMPPSARDRVAAAVRRQMDRS